MKATARAHPNIALIKYWGKRNRELNLPAVPSLSLTLDQYHTTTTVEWGVEKDEVTLNRMVLGGQSKTRVLQFLDRVWGPNRPPVAVESQNNFPTAAGLASSSSGFAALTLAASTAANKTCSKTELSILARQGSGSACRSLWGGWVVWPRGIARDGTDSHGKPLAPKTHWDVRMLVAIIASGPKPMSSTNAMIHTEQSSALYAGWTAAADADLKVAQTAVLARDLPTLGTVMEESTLRMHATMMSAQPSVRYWTPQTLMVMDAVEALRASGTPAYYTMDAGPNVKVLCEAHNADHIAKSIQKLCERVDILKAGPDACLC